MMCGICGKLVWKGGEEVSENLIRQMSGAMAHRGPDGEGSHIFQSNSLRVGLGHRRLSIIDLSEAGQQPMSDETQTVWIVYNGEVYNFRELRRDLEGIGYRFRSGTDTEVVLQAYRAWGTACLDRLQGMFAFGIWDSGKRRLFLARDRVGIKPLYYAATSTSLLFASELKALLLDPSLDRDIDSIAVDRFFTFGYITFPETIFRSIKKLPPAHFLTWENGKLQMERYWRYQIKGNRKRNTPQAWLEEFRHVFHCAVSRQMTSDVPLGAFLSGGIDSSLVVGEMAGCSNRPVQTFTIGFGQNKWSEASYARTVSERFGTEHYNYDVNPDAMAILPTLVWHLDEPFGDSSIVPTYYVSKMARQKVTVALSGDGGDELFAGYTRYQGERIAEILRMFPERMLTGFVSALNNSLSRRRSTLRRLRGILTDARVDLIERYRNKASICKPETRMSLYSQGFAEDVEGSDDQDQLRELLESQSSADFVDRLTVLDLEFYLPNDMLMKVDKMSMACSLEVRVPFLDEKVVEVAAQIPSDLKLRGFTTKYLLRRIASETLPSKIWRRRKQGFGVPIQSWFRKDMISSAREILMDPQTLCRDIFCPKAIDSLLDGQQAKTSDHGNLIFALLCFEFWNRVFVDARGA